MRTAADSISLANLIPVAGQFDVLMGYDDGQWPDAASIAEQFPGKTVVRITVAPDDNEGDMLDVESGDATPTDAPGWVTRRRLAGHIGPLVYFPDSWRADVVQAFADQGVALPGLFAAAMPGSGAVLQQPGDAGHQYADNGSIDFSVLVDYLPGIDPAPSPTPEEDPMGSSSKFVRTTAPGVDPAGGPVTQAGTAIVIEINPGGDVYVKNAEPGTLLSTADNQEVQHGGAIPGTLDVEVNSSGSGVEGVWQNQTDGRMSYFNIPGLLNPNGTVVVGVNAIP